MEKTQSKQRLQFGRFIITLVRVCLFAAFCLTLVVASPHCEAVNPTDSEKAIFRQVAQELPLLGHRNWIVIADMAYPLQISPGVKTIYVGGDHLGAIRSVLQMINDAPHVRPVVHVDKELNNLVEKNAPGIESFRADLKQILEKEHVSELLHEEVISKLDQAGETFKIVVLKTDCTLPYTSVFLQLECGYWSEDAERHLRKSMK